MDSLPFLRYLLLGQLRREFILPPTGKAVIDQPGGSLLYAAAGLSIWENDAGLVGRISEDYPRQWLALAQKASWDTRGIRFLSESINHRWFCAYSDLETRHFDRPVAHFARVGLPFPKSLLGYSEPSSQLDSRTLPSPLTIRSNDIPTDYLDATAAHLCPLDYLSHALIPAVLRQGHVSTITLDPSANYMSPVFWEEIPHVVKGVTAFLTSEEKALALFQGRSQDLWEIAETLAGYGCEVVVIKRGPAGQMVYDHTSHARWIIPAYPARVSNPTGAGDAFCGGFLAGFKSTYSALEGALAGNISASMVIEGSGPFYALDSLPGLARARLDALRGMLRKA